MPARQTKSRRLQGRQAGTFDGGVAGAGGSSTERRAAGSNMRRRPCSAPGAPKAGALAAPPAAAELAPAGRTKSREGSSVMAPAGVPALARASTDRISPNEKPPKLIWAAPQLRAASAGEGGSRVRAWPLESDERRVAVAI